MNKRFLFIILLVLTFFTACGNGGNGDEITDGSPSPAPSSPVNTPYIPPEPDFGGTLTLTMRYPLTLNPLLNEDETVARILSLIFEPLFILDETQRPQPNPALLESYSMSTGMGSVTLTLRSDAYWSNGERITPSDVAFSIEYLRSTAPENAIYKNCVSNILSTSVSGDTIRINLIQPYGQIGYMLCFPIIPSGYYKGVSASNAKQMNPVGNGPYMFESYVQTRELNLVSSELTLREPAYITNIRVLITASDESDANAFVQGIAGAIFADYESWSSVRNATKVRQAEYVTSYFDFVGFNFDNWLLTDVNIRRAIAHSIPYDDILEGVYHNAAVLSPTPISPASWLYNPDIKTSEFDLELAASCIGGWEGLAFRILVNTENPERVRVAQLLAYNLGLINIQATVRELTWDAYAQAIENREFDIILGGYKLSTVPDLSFMLHSDAAADQYQNKEIVAAGTNILHYKNETLDSLMAAAFGASGESTTIEAYGELQKFICNDLPLVGLVFRKSAMLVNTEISGPLSAGMDTMYKEIEKWYIITK